MFFSRLCAVLGIMLAATTASHAGVDDVKRNMRRLYPATTVTSVKPTPVKGLYEIILGKNMAYTDDSAEYFVFGDIVRMSDQTNISAPTREELQKINFAEFPLDQAIKFVAGKGKRKLAVFSDPDCPYCKKLETELMKLDNVTIYVFTNPLAGLHPNAPTVSKKIWCSPDRAKAWRDYLTGNVMPTAPDTCKNPVDDNIRLARTLGFDGTPMAVLEDGSVVQGAVSAGEMDYKLDAIYNKRK